MTTSGSTCQSDLAIFSGTSTLTRPTPLANAPLITKEAAPRYLSLPVTNKVLPRLYLLAFLGGKTRLKFFISFLEMLKIFF